MRAFLLLLPLAVGGCAAPLGALAGANLAAIPVIHRNLFDAAYSVVTGRDCSVVRLDRNESYCVPPEEPIRVPPFCTPSLGAVDCWTGPDSLPGPRRRGVADQAPPTPAQEADRTARWPRL